ncbi:hypothetical protein E2C01_058152 [Portunus trituberculatus]|uniref:Uncharacterized protein n=1 Tax=Portunus trituberculatus TaxID=210409 RepID=A0A5B7GZ27_PORTR|nr:hypothetical protein [Portunus trituberculatus]
MLLSGANWAIVHAELLDQAEAVFSLLPPNTLKKMWVIGGAVDSPAIEDLMAYAPIPPVTQVRIPYSGAGCNRWFCLYFLCHEKICIMKKKRIMQIRKIRNTFHPNVFRVTLITPINWLTIMNTL